MTGLRHRRIGWVACVVAGFFLAWLGALWWKQLSLFLPMVGEKFGLNWLGLHASEATNAKQWLWSFVPMGFLLTFEALMFLALLQHRKTSPLSRGVDRQEWLALLLLWVAGMICLFLYGADLPWYRVASLMAFEGAPPFQHRIMFLVLALALQHLLPGLDAAGAYLLSQGVALAAALWAVRRFASLFVGANWAFVAPFVFAAMWMPTVSYYTFYDIGIVLVFAICLHALMAGHYGAYLALFALGTLNHEITLFLVIVSAAVLYGQMPWRRLIVLVVLQLLIYGLVRMGLFALMPMNRAWESGKLQVNINMLLHRKQELLMSLGPLVAWYGLALWNWKSLPLALRRSLVMLPCLVGMTLMVGQLNEARQFDALIPVVAAMLASGLKQRMTV